ncbi:MAG: GxxExxY protein [Phycisphaeraceae bacterium]
MDQRDPRTYAIIGAAMTVHRELGPGFLEAVYQEALEIELRSREIAFSSQTTIAIEYKGQPLQSTYRADLVCFDRVIVEIKAINNTLDVHQAQLINYLKATGKTVGLLLNFGTSSLVHRRLVYNHKV